MSADGNWKITLKTPMGAQSVNMSIKTSGDSFTGTMAGPMGNQDINGKVDGDTLTWDTSITQPMPMNLEFTATVAGDTLNGSAKLGAFGSAPLTGERV